MYLFRLLTLLLLLPAGCLSAQDLTGIWQGTFVSGGGETYKFEVQVLQSAGNRLTGVSYSYLDKRFYGKAELNGYYTKGSKTALLNELKTVELRMSAGSVACIMKCSLTYRKQGREEYLTGVFTSAYEQAEPASRIEKGDNCGGGKVYLERVELSDFYVEPFLRTKPTVKKVPAKTPPPVARQPQRTPAKTPSRTTPTLPKKTPAVKPPVTKRDTVAVQRAPVEQAAPRVVPQRVPLPSSTRSRTNELTKTLIVTSEEISVRLYDNGEIDNDTISVYMDGNLVLDRKRLSASPLTLQLKMDEAHPEHVLVMVAENLGRIPPNTSLMIVQDGDRRYEVRITSTEQKNAAVQFRWEKRTP